jgi:palmitoyltransferase ZDHHC9/14/18
LKWQQVLFTDSDANLAYRYSFDDFSNACGVSGDLAPSLLLLRHRSFRLPFLSSYSASSIVAVPPAHHAANVAPVTRRDTSQPVHRLRLSMAGRPSTARSEISSAISDDGYASRPQSAINQNPSLPNPTSSQHGYTHLRGFAHPLDRNLRPDAPPTTSAPADSSARHSQTSQTSRTHVPSLTAQGFHKPMSSHRLQALRRPPGSKAVKAPESIPDGEGDTEEAASVASSRQGPFHPLPKGHRPAVSLATDYTHSEAPENFDTTSHDYVSNPDGDTGLVNGSNREKPRPKHLNIGTAHTSDDAPQKSPLSFRSGFSLRNKNRPAPGHQHLSSNATSPDFPPAKTSPAALQSSMGKNYEYFEGNTIFWGGGRFQNARDRPVNVATGIILVLPAILFFAFS